MRIVRIDHVVPTVANIDATCDFYGRVLGMQVEAFGAGRVALTFGQQKINLHQSGKEFEPKALRPTPGSADICVIADASMSEVHAHLLACGIAIIEGPVPRTGATGPIVSIYFRDPDGNLVEVSTYAAT